MTDPKPSKTARKREYLARQALGESLIGLTIEQLRGMRLDESLIQAVTEAAVMTSRGALRRQRQLIGKLMRDVDPEPIRQALDALHSQEIKAKRLFRAAEAWRDRILQRGQSEIDAFVALTGRQSPELSSLLSEYHTASSESNKRRLRRKLFRLVHAELSAARVTIAS